MEGAAGWASADGADSGVGSFSLGSSFGSISFLTFVLGGDEFQTDHTLDSAFDFVDSFHISCVDELPFGEAALVGEERHEIVIGRKVFP